MIRKENTLSMYGFQGARDLPLAIYSTGKKRQLPLKQQKYMLLQARKYNSKTPAEVKSSH